jgi:hypothetical protein
MLKGNLAGSWVSRAGALYPFVKIRQATGPLHQCIIERNVRQNRTYISKRNRFPIRQAGNERPFKSPHKSLNKCLETRSMSVRCLQEHTICTSCSIYLSPSTLLEVEDEVTTDGQSASLSSCWVRLEPMARFLFCLTIASFLTGHPLWREDGSVIYSYNCFWAVPEQSLWRPSPAELTTIFYCLTWDSPNLEDHVPIFISPRNRVA